MDQETRDRLDGEIIARFMQEDNAPQNFGGYSVSSKAKNYKEWNNLMPVVKRINEEAIKEEVTPHELLREPFFREITKAVMDVDVERSYEWVLKSIHWLSQRKWNRRSKNITDKF